MKKFGIILLTLFYFLVASSFAINIHYCGGKLKEISILKHEDCCCGSKKKAKGCCKEKTIICKIQDNQKPALKIAIAPPVSNKQIVALYVMLGFFEYEFCNTVEPEPSPHSPPDYYSDPVFLLNRNFRV